MSFRLIRDKPEYPEGTRWEGRKRLPTRREIETTEVIDSTGNEYSVSVGFYPDSGRPGEVFIHSSSKSGSDKEIAEYTLGVSLSMLLQYGAYPISLLHSFPKNEDDTPAGIAARAMELVAEYEAK